MTLTLRDLPTTPAPTVGAPVGQLGLGYPRAPTNLGAYTLEARLAVVTARCGVEFELVRGEDDLWGVLRLDIGDDAVGRMFERAEDAVSEVEENF